VDALDRGGFVRYEERTASVLGDGADLLSRTQSCSAEQFLTESCPTESRA
jgi:hypothetical protein